MYSSALGREISQGWLAWLKVVIMHTASEDDHKAKEKAPCLYCVRFLQTREGSLIRKHLWIDRKEEENFLVPLIKIQFQAKPATL
jgi:hypothetical protein